MRGRVMIDAGLGMMDIKELLSHLEDDYRLAAISEKNYAKLKKRYTDMLKRFKGSEKEEMPNTDIKIKSDERKDLEMFLESLEEQYKNGEINKEDYENIKNVNMSRLKEIDNGIKKEGGIFKKLFGRIKKEKKEKPKEEKPKDMQEGNNPDEMETEEVVPVVGKSGEAELRIPDETEDVKLPDKKDDIMPEPETKIESEERPKKKGFLKSMFGKKKAPKEDKAKSEEPKKEEATKEEKLEMPKKEEAKKEEPKAEKKETEPKEEVKSEEKKEEKPKEEKLEPGEIEEVTPEVIEKLANQMAESMGGTQEVETPAAEEGNKEEDTSLGPGNEKLKIELEKLKVMIDTVRDSKKSTDETIQNMSESIGEIRSMVMQGDANFKTTMANVEKLEDEVSGIRPNEMTKKLNEFKDKMEKDRIEVEKLERKFKGTVDKMNEVYEMLKSIGGVENLMNINGDVQNKLKDINEAIKYIQRIGTKTEKIFIDLNKGLEDLILLKAKQEDFDESLKNILSSIDNLNVKLKDYVSKDDNDEIRKEILLVKKQIEEIKKVLPIAELKLPENMIKLRKDKEDIEMFLESLETQAIEGKIDKAEYEEMKKINLKKLKDIENKLKKEWNDIDRVIKPDEPEEKETEEDAQEKVEKKAKKKRKRKAKKKTKTESDRKKKILKGLKLNS